MLLFFRFDHKVHACLWDRLHDNLYMPVVWGITEVLTGVTVFYCYLQIFLFVRKTRNNVSAFWKFILIWHYLKPNIIPDSVKSHLVS